VNALVEPVWQMKQRHGSERRPSQEKDSAQLIQFVGKRLGVAKPPVGMATR
jgi:hypothetical protein